MGNKWYLINCLCGIIMGFLFCWMVKPPKTIVKIETKTDTITVEKIKDIDFNIGDEVCRLYRDNKVWINDTIREIGINSNGLYYVFYCESLVTGDIKKLFVPANRVFKK